MKKNMSFIFIAFGLMYATSACAAYLNEKGEVVIPKQERAQPQLDGATPPNLLGSTKE